MHNKHVSISRVEINEPGFAPILVTYEDLGHHLGRIKFSHGQRSWSCFWNALGPQTVAQMFSTTDARQLARQLTKVNQTVYDKEATQLAFRKLLLTRRRLGEIPRIDARVLYEASRNLLVPEQQSDALRSLFGAQWWDSLKRKPNPEFEHLVQVIEVIQNRRNLKELDQLMSEASEGAG